MLERATSRRGLFLDLDGTLADSLGAMRQSYRHFLAHFGKQADEGEFDRLNGPPLASIVADLAATHDLKQPVDRLTAFYWRLIAEAYRSVEPMPGALALVSAARERGMAVAVVTSNSAALALTWLMRVGLADYIRTVVGCEDVRCGKPAPEPYLLALARTGCAVDRSLAVEDSASGVRAAAAAGLAVCRLGTAETPDLLAAIGRLGAKGDGERT